MYKEKLNMHTILVAPPRDKLQCILEIFFKTIKIFQEFKLAPCIFTMLCAVL